MIEAAFKEKEFDATFCLSLVLQGARNLFVMELGKNVDVYVEQVDN
jgi:hypothetical protein